MSSALKQFLIILGLLILLLIFPLLLFVYLLLFFRSRLVALVLSRRNLTFVDGSDALSGIDVTSTDNLLQAYIVLDGRLDAADVRRTLTARLISPDTGSALYPRLQRFVRLRLGHLVWSDEPRFNIDDHVIEYQGAPPTTDAELNLVVAGIINAPFACATSGWEFVVVRLDGDHFRSASGPSNQQPSDDVISEDDAVDNAPSSTGSAQTCLVLRVNHCIMDGVTFVRLFMECLADNSDVHRETFRRRMASPSPPGAATEARHPARRLARPLLAALRAPYVQLRTLFNRDRNALHDSQRLSRTRRKIFVSRVLPLADVKAIKTQSGTTINDVILSCVAGGLRRYLATRGQDSATMPVTHAMVPVHFQPADQPLTTKNFFSVAVVELATDRATNLERLSATKVTMERLKASLDVDANRLVGLAIASVMPKCMVDSYFTMAPMTMCVSNLRGPDEVILFGGGRVVSVNVVSPHFYTTGVSYGVFSYMDNISVTLTIDSGILSEIAEIDRVIDCFMKEFEDLKSSIQQAKLLTNNCDTATYTSLDLP